jgi:hypothetical protein
VNYGTLLINYSGNNLRSAYINTYSHVI